MLARLATFNSAPAELDDANVELLRQTIKATPGFVAGFHLADEERLVRDTRSSSSRTPTRPARRDALATRPADRRVGADPDKVQFLTARAF